jgi:adenylate cyclase
MKPGGLTRVERRLAAILAADVAGYSRLMGADEESAFTLLAIIRHHAETAEFLLT